MRANKGFSDILRAEENLSGVEDFTARMPRLFFNQMTNGGVNSYRQRFLCYYPRDWDGYEPAPRGETGGIVVAGHLVTFLGSEEERRIITMTEPLQSRSPPVHRPSKKDMVELMGEITPTESSVFERGVLLETPSLAVGLTSSNGHDRFAGNIKPYWTSYWAHVGQPLVSVLWRK